MPVLTINRLQYRNVRNIKLGIETHVRPIGYARFEILLKIGAIAARPTAPRVAGAPTKNNHRRAHGPAVV